MPILASQVATGPFKVLVEYVNRPALAAVPTLNETSMKHAAVQVVEWLGSMPRPPVPEGCVDKRVYVQSLEGYVFYCMVQDGVYILCITQKRAMDQVCDCVWLWDGQARGH